MNVSQLDTAKRGHHPFSASALQSLEACPHQVSRGGTSAAAEAGVLLHKAVEIRDMSILDTPEQVAAAQRCVALEDYEAKCLSQIGSPKDKLEITGEVYLPVVGEHVEVDENGVEWKGITGGSCDRIFVKGSLAVVLDWKFGQHLVTPTAENTQGMVYAAAVMEEWPKVDEVKVTFFHPYLEVSEGASLPFPEYTHIFSREELPDLHLRIRLIIAKAKRARLEGFDSGLPAIPKTALCLYCKHMEQADCPALGKLMVLGGSKHKEILVPDVFNPMQLATPEQYGLAYKFANQFELVAKAIKKRVTDAACKEGVSVAGYEIASRKERQIGSASGVKAIAIKHGITEDEFDGCVSLPITKVEEKIKQKAGKGKGAGAVRDFQHDLEESGLVSVSDGYSFLREIKADKPQIVVGDADILI